MKEKLELLRASVRPVVTYIVVGCIMALGIKLALRFADADMAKTIVVMILGAGTMIIGVWFGGRQTVPK